MHGESATLLPNGNELQASNKLSSENAEKSCENENNDNILAGGRKESNLVASESAESNIQSAAYSSQSAGIIITNETSSNNATRTPVPVVHRNRPDFHLLKKESARLSIYHDWPTTAKVVPPPLVKEGFFYLGRQDRVQCAFCKEHLRNWAADDIPEVEHRKHFPNCPFVQCIDCGNVTDMAECDWSGLEQHPHEPNIASGASVSIVVC